MRALELICPHCGRSITVARMAAREFEQLGDVLCPICLAGGVRSILERVFRTVTR